MFGVTPCSATPNKYFIITPSRANTFGQICFVYVSRLVSSHLQRHDYLKKYESWFICLRVNKVSENNQ